MTKERINNIDKLFQSSLAGDKIEPSAAVWESLRKHVPAKGGSSGTFLFLITAIAIGAFTFIMHSTLVDNGQELAANIETQNETFTKDQQADADIVPVMETIIDTEPTKISPTQEIAIEEKQIDEAIVEDRNTPTEELNIPAKNENKEAATLLLASTEKELIPSTTSQLGEPLPRYSYLLHLVPVPAQFNSTVQGDIGIRPDADPGEPIFDLNIKDGYAKKADLLFGASFSPAVNLYPERQNHNDYSFDIVAAYEKSRFIVESGLGANFSSESAKYQINYTTYDSVGYYIGVSSFTSDPANPDSIIFQTKLESIYDSIDRYSIQENTNKYVYLQIPIRIGYRVIQLDRFSLDLKAGLLFSLLLSKDIPAAPYQGNDADQVDVIRQYPDRLDSYWQYTASVSFNYQMNRQIRLSIEPFYRQSLKSPYSPYSVYPAKSPYGFGLRGGIYFHF